jgi:hypothetical protein
MFVDGYLLQSVSTEELTSTAARACRFGGARRAVTSPFMSYQREHGEEQDLIPAAAEGLIELHQRVQLVSLGLREGQLSGEGIGFVG